MRSVARDLMNKGNAYERQLGRMLSRGRVRGIPPELQKALEISNKLVKDFGAAPPANAMTGGQVQTPVASGPPKRKKASRLALPHE